jgi:uncharacterized protein (DUF2235 family)
MAKRLVVCCDGTWNTPDQTSDGQPCPTNVTKIALAVAPEDMAGTAQVMYYHRGVGTDRGDRLPGGAFGFGLSRDVQRAYRFIVENYEPGDQLFFFGFSRGAFTARSTVGFVRNAGILRRQNAGLLDEAYALYRDRSPGTNPRAIESELFRRSYSHETRIRFIGVWDTVGALGIPLSGLRLVNLINRRWQFHDTDLSTMVDAAFQALAIDEKRQPFKPTIWSQQPDAVGQRLEQVWFSGVHCDVGGGYPSTALSDITLRWMVERARSSGLDLRPDVFSSTCPDPLAEIQESRKGVYRLLPPFVRPMGQKNQGHESVGSSVLERQKKDPAYAPPALMTFLEGPHDVTQVSDLRK